MLYKKQSTFKNILQGMTQVDLFPESVALHQVPRVLSHEEYEAVLGNFNKNQKERQWGRRIYVSATVLSLSMLFIGTHYKWHPGSMIVFATLPLFFKIFSYFLLKIAK